MARVTIEDCIDKVHDRFELVAVAAQRAKDIASGAPLTIERKGEKDTVIALREIAEGTIDVESLREGLVKSYQRKRELEAPQQSSPDGEAFIAEELSGDIMLAAEEDVTLGLLPEESGEDVLAEEEDTSSLSDESDDEDIRRIAEGGSMEGISFADDNVDVDD